MTCLSPVRSGWGGRGEEQMAGTTGTLKVGFPLPASLYCLTMDLGSTEGSMREL